MQLIQQNPPPDPPGHPQDLPPNENRIETGDMSDCVSVIILFNPDANLRYQNMRGWHGGGGVTFVDMAQMLAGVPNHPTTQVIVIPGNYQSSHHAQEAIREHVFGALTNHASVFKRFVNPRRSATVDRMGNLT